MSSTFDRLPLNLIIQYALALFLFLLPWQTRYIYEPAVLNGTYWEYGTLSLYATELLGWGIVLLFAWQIIISNCFPLVRKYKFIISKKWIDNRQFKKFCILAVFLISIILFFIAYSTNPSVSFQYMIRLLQALCLAIIMGSIPRDFTHPYPAQAEIAGSPPPHTTTYHLPPTTFVAAFWLGGVGQGLFALYQFFTQHIGANKWLGLAAHNPSDLGAFVIEFGDERWLRAYGAFGSPNSLGIYLAVILAVGLLLYLNLKQAKLKLAVTVGQLIILSGLILSFSRGAWLAAAAGLLMIGILVFRHQKISSQYPLNIFLISNNIQYPISNIFRQIFYYLLMFIFFFITLHPLFVARVNTNNRLEHRSINERRTQIGEAVPLLKNNRLWGVGPGAYTAALARQYPGRPAWQYQPVHNVYFLALIEWGSLGFAGLLLLYGVIIKNLLTKNPLAGGLIATLLVAGLFDHWLGSLYTGMLLWWLVIGLSRSIGEVD